MGYASGVMVFAVTQTGEPGYSLYIPSEYALHLYNKIMTVRVQHKNLVELNAGTCFYLLICVWPKNVHKSLAPKPSFQNQSLGPNLIAE